MPYNPEDHPYPAHLYGPDGAVRVIWTADEDAAAKAEGWVKHPSLIGKPPPPVVKSGKGKRGATLTPETPLEAAISKAVEAKADEFDRTAAVATLEAAGYEIDKDVTDAELVEALAELAK